MKKQLRYKGLTAKERLWLKRQERKDLLELLAGITFLAAVLIFTIVALIGAFE